MNTNSLTLLVPFDVPSAEFVCEHNTIFDAYDHDFAHHQKWINKWNEIHHNRPILIKFFIVIFQPVRLFVFIKLKIVCFPNMQRNTHFSQLLTLSASIPRALVLFFLFLAGDPIIFRIEWENVKRHARSRPPSC